MLFNPPKENEWDLERELSKLVSEYEDSYSVYHIRHHSSSYNESGISDWLFVINGYFISLELKNPNKPSYLRKKQFDHLMQVTEAGGIGIVCYDLDIVDQVFNACLKNDETVLFDLGWRQHFYKSFDDYRHYAEMNKFKSIIF